MLRCEKVILEFDENGNLPPGVHWAEWEEFVERFGYNLDTEKIINGLSLVMTQLKAAGCRTIYIDGSFITSKERPGDFDACWDADDVDMNYLRKNVPILLNHFDRQAQKVKYRGDIFRSDELVGDLNVNSFEFFQRDRELNKKGIIAIDLVRWDYD